MTRCAAIKADGERCKGDAMPGAEWCYSHHPDRAEQRHRNASRGGKSGGRGRPNRELGDLKNQLQELTDAVLDGRVDRADAAVCGQLLNVKLRALEQERRWREVEELAVRIETVEGVLKSREKRQAR